MNQEQPSNSSLAFVLVKVNRRSKSVLAEARKQAITKQEAIFKSFLQNQQICNSTNNQSNSSKILHDFQQQQNISPPKNVTPQHISNTRRNEQANFIQLQQNSQQLKDQHNFASDSNQNQILLMHQNQLQQLDIDGHNDQPILLKNGSQMKQNDSFIEQEIDKNNFSNINYDNNRFPSPQQLPNQFHNNFNIDEQYALPMFLQTYMKPCKQKSLSFYKQNLQHKKQISQKMNNTKFLQIWNDENDYQVKIQHNPYSTNHNQKIEPTPKKIQVYNELPVFFPKSKQLRKSFSKAAASNFPLQKQFMGEDILVQNSQQIHQNSFHHQINQLQNSHTSSKEFIEINTIQCLHDKQQVSNQISQPQNCQLLPDPIQKTNFCREKRSSSVKETQSTQRRRINTNTGGVAQQLVENSALQKILDIYSKPSQKNSNKKRFSHLEKQQTFINTKENLQDKYQPNLSLTPARHNQSFNAGQKNIMLAQNKLQLDNLPIHNDVNTKILFQRQRHFKSLFNKLQKHQFCQKDQFNNTPQNNNSTNNTSCQQTIPNVFQSTSTTAKQTVETVEDNQPNKYQQQNNFFRTSKAKLFESNQQERHKFYNLESSKSSPNRKKPTKTIKQNIFERGFTLKENEQNDNLSDYNYNLSNYVTDQRHII
ncbi:hypothetical protein TTHERM_00448620 (macronuclear) [Tetrahymena thermophila SB210]|uniref:Uncharacterized protein n=1 Tax=Tetrahymena thermophila (strain SB210) TaxID=312017 RepID=Q239F2_TETTS|nr:hypothetical protein TTHERM_00448620 [Tetrahymena thermophila SB210]EAR93018.1 hypothetical protein TTHERM_00448620 [Tetrahymena thermophila SB210]|eukprot:XP_001013263.1 hypothetical protein TTHERM_00448620 [Tetrahymena thermophila SB210]